MARRRSHASKRNLELVLSCAEDHRAFSVEVELVCGVSLAGGSRKEKKKQINNQHLHDPRLRQIFEEKLRWFYPGDVGADTFHGLAVKFVRETAISIFGTAPAKPRSPWVSQEAVMISKMRSPVRRTMNGARKIQAVACLGEAFWMWRARLGAVPFAAGVSLADDRGWVAVAKANDRRSLLMSARRLECAPARQLAKLGWYVVNELKQCRRSFFAETLKKLQCTHNNGDTEVSCRILRQLGKRAPRQVKSLKSKDGVATKDEDEIGEVWTQHLVNVLGGRKATSAVECHAKSKRTVEEYSFWPSRCSRSKTL